MCFGEKVFNQNPLKKNKNLQHTYININMYKGSECVMVAVAFEYTFPAQTTLTIS